MAGEKTYLRVPPDSTGKRVKVIHTAQLFYNSSVTENFAWSIGGFYYANMQEGITAPTKTAFHVHGHIALSSTTGILEIHFNKLARYKNSQFVIGSDILDEDGITKVAEVQEVEEIYINSNIVVGYDNPEYGWDIDRFGSGKMTFAEGPPQVTGTGALRVNDGLILASYDFGKSNLPNEFTTSVEGSADVDNSWDADTRGVALTVGTQLLDRVTHTSNLYHSFELGGSNLYVMAARSGDTGKAGVTRAWGAFDAFDGYFFSIAGSDDTPGDTMMGPVTPGSGSSLRVIHRWSHGGMVRNHAILQRNWNKDTLLGTSGSSNPSGMKIDVTNINSYWIDYQFLGGGRTRWGVFYNGERIVCHEMYHGNGEEGIMVENHNPLTSASRPICWAMVNTATTGSISQFFAYGGSVLSEQRSDPLKSAQQISVDMNRKLLGQPHLQPYWRHKQTRGGTTNWPSMLRTGGFSSESSTQYMVTMSPTQFLLSGDENHTVYQPLTFQIANHRIRDNAPRVAEVRAFYGCIMRGYQFEDERPSVPTVDIDYEGDHLAHVVEIGRFMVNGHDSFDFATFSDNFQYGTVRNTADQIIAKSKQELDGFTASSDRYGTGINRVLIEVGTHPIFGPSGLSDRHYFWDTQPVVLRQFNGGEDLSQAFSSASTFGSVKTTGGTGYASVDRVDSPNDWYYLSYVTRTLGWLYNSQADIADDRLTRTLDVDDCANLQIGTTLTVTGGDAAGATCGIMKIEVDGTPIPASDMIGGTKYQVVTVGSTDYTQVGAIINAPGEIFTASGQAIGGLGTVVPIAGNPGTLVICGRGLETAAAANATVSALDVGLTSGTFTTDSGGAGNITGSGTSSDAADYWTSLKALQWDADLGLDVAEDVGADLLSLYGGPPPRAAWTFMMKWLENSNEDEDGDRGPSEENSITNWNIFWRERLQ